MKDSFYISLKDLPYNVEEGHRIYHLDTPFRVMGVYPERQLAQIEKIYCSYNTIPYDIVDLVKTKDQGFSIVSKHDLSLGVCVGIGWYVNADAKELLEEPTSSKIFKIRTPLGGFINHSNYPNCEVKHKEIVNYNKKRQGDTISADQWLLFVSKPIPKGDELLINYDKPVTLCQNKKFYK